MQETTVSFDPMYEGQLPWFAKFFVMYLAAVLLVSAFRAIRLLRSLRYLREMERETAGQPNGEFQLLWDVCHARTDSIKNLSVLTFLLSFLVSAWEMTKVLTGVTMQKATLTAFFAGAAAEVLTIFSLGILVCTVLYAVALLYDAALTRCKLRAAPPK